MRKVNLIGFFTVFLILMFFSTAVFADESVKLVYLDEEFNLTINQTADIVDYSDMMIKLLEINPICYPNESCPTVVPSATFEVRYNKTIETYTDQAYGDFIAIHGVEIDLQKIDTIMDDNGIYTTFIVRKSTWVIPIPPEEESVENVTTEPIGPEEGVYGIYATLGEKFKLQETQPVKIIDYLDKENNPLRIYLQDINLVDQSIKCEVLFSDKSEIIKIPITEAKIVFGAVINFISIDDSWEYATLRVSYAGQIPSEEPVNATLKPYCDATGSKSEGWYYITTGLIKYDNCKGCEAACKYTGTEKEGWYSSCTDERIKLTECSAIIIPIAEEVKIIPSQKETAVRATRALTILETVKTSIASEQAIGIETVQAKIIESKTESDMFEEEVNKRGISYGFRWFFGMVAEQEKQDVIFLREQASQLTETADLLLEISKQVEEPAKTVLIEQAASLNEQAQEILEKAENKEKRARGFLSWLGIR